MYGYCTLAYVCALSPAYWQTNRFAFASYLSDVNDFVEGGNEEGMTYPTALIEILI